MESLKDINLSPEQARFATIISEYPWLEKYWNWQKRECAVDSLATDIGLMIHGEQQLALFFVSIWSGAYETWNDGQNTYCFDFTVAATILDEKDRKLIAGWILDPFCP